MDTRLLKHYEAELAYLREMGAEFAAAYPKIAARLGMDGIEVLDPYVERLLEGAAFLTARVQLELELQYPAFTSQLLEIVYPHYLAPTPSMMVAELQPDMENSALAEGFEVPRHTELRSSVIEGAQKACRFRTAQDVTLWPVEIAEAEYIDGRGALVAAGVVRDAPGRAAIRLRLRRAAGLPLEPLPLDTLTLFLGGEAASGAALLELLGAETTAVVTRSTDRRDDWVVPVPGGVVPRGLERDEALLPLPRASFDGYRLLQEYFAMPERFHFVDLRGLQGGIARAKGSEIDIYIILRDGRPELAPSITAEAFKLHCVPAVNLFERRCDRVPVGPETTRHHVVVDRTAPMDYEVHSVLSVVGISKHSSEERVFRPFYSSDAFTAAGSGEEDAYFVIQRKLRERSERERLRGPRTGYLGSETYLSLVDAAQAPHAADLAQLAVRALVTNRDLPILMSLGADDLFHLPSGGPVTRIRTPVSPTRPRPTLAQGEAAWRLVSHLSLNYLSIADDEGGAAAAAALRELIGLYAPPEDRALAKQLDGITAVETRPVVRRMSDGVMSTAVRGLQITVTFDESLYEGSSVYRLGAVLESFFRKYVTLNSFTETVIASQQRGEIARWAPRAGKRRII
ncbi:type VI secretion system baseplate subunit TssF [Rhodosalinus halophilus]|uniref:Type VI secretion system baseplate subunit TssF n=1 Tax=Rhodosalinus halophilus TaxID=2259333 RepID=A0A365UCY7_9RHOB|nr:type VI secretion system baseplate subunit TssF [Rhodosalinus halophilus]RBI87371.1 type VI secretion system baseplate subunit TssF [Rhodosalinus halophilus]